MTERERMTGSGRTIAGGTRLAPEDRLLALIAEAPAPLAAVGAVAVVECGGRRRRFPLAAVEALVGSDLARRTSDGFLAATEAGLARLRRAGGGEVDPFFAQHAELRAQTIVDEAGARTVIVNDGESPLAWLRRRKGPDGEPLISSAQFAAGERLRSDLTRAQIMPRVTANWSAAVASGRRGGEGGVATDAMIAARQRVDRALAAAGDEFAGLLLDVCGFLKGLADIERERGWPVRSAKLVLDMALTRLARHYGLASEARGPERGRALRFWGAEGYRPSIDGDAA